MTHRESGSGETGVRKRRNTAGRRQRLPETAKQGWETGKAGRRGPAGGRGTGGKAGGWEGGAMRG